MDLYKTNRILHCQDMRDDRERAFSAITTLQTHPRTRASKYYELSMWSAERERLFLRIAISLTRLTVAYGIVHTSKVDFTMYVRNRNSIHRGARKSCELTSKRKTFIFPFLFFLNFYHRSAIYIKIYENFTKCLQAHNGTRLFVIFCDKIALFVNVIVIVIFFYYYGL